MTSTLDSFPVAHEGNPKEDSITISGGSVLSTATLDIIIPGFIPPPVIIPIETPPPPGGGGDCTPLLSSEHNAPAIAICETDAGDGVVTFPGDYTFDPAFFGNACENYYDVFRFGLNADSFDDDVNNIPVLYQPTPSLWIPPTGALMFNSTCPALVSKPLIFNLQIPSSSPARRYYNLTPDTFQANCINIDNLATGAGINDGSEPNPTTSGGAFDCRFQFVTSGSTYYSFVEATYMGELGTPIAGIGMITDTGTGAKITGYGMIIDRIGGTVKLVQWLDAFKDNFQTLAFSAYIPQIGDSLTLRVRMECLCPYPGLSNATFFPVAGSVFGSVLRGGTLLSMQTNGQSLTTLQWQALRHAALMSMTVDNNVAQNLIVFRTVYTKFFATYAAC